LLEPPQPAPIKASAAAPAKAAVRVSAVRDMAGTCPRR